MARIRSIHPNMFRDEQFLMVSVAARVLLLGLGTFSDRRDRFPWDVAAIKAAVLPADRVDVPSLLAELLGAGLICRDGDVGTVTFLFGHPRRIASGWERLRQWVFARDDYRCVYCGSTEEPLHCDHVHPKARGGGDDPSNLATACRPCNLSKNDRLLSEWMPA